MPDLFLIGTIALFVAGGLGLSIALALRGRVRSLAAARFARRLARHETLVVRLRGGPGDDFDAAFRELSFVADATLREAILDRARDTASEEALAPLLQSYENLGLVSEQIERLLRSPRWEERAGAAERLGRIGSVRAVPALLQVVRDTRDEDEDVRGAALRALGRIRDPAALPALIETLGVADAALPQRIAEIIARFGADAVPALVAELRNLECEARRMWAADILGKVADPRAALPLVESLGDVSPEVRAKAAAGLGRLREARAVDRLLEVLLSDPIPFVRTRVAQALGAIGHPKVIDYLIHGLKDAEWWVRVRAVEALEQLGEIAADALIVALEDDDEEVRRRAAVALERTGYVQSCIASIGSEGFRPDLFRVLNLVGNAGATEVLYERLGRSTGKMQEHLVRIVGDFGDPKAGPALCEILRSNGDPRLRSRTIKALAKLRWSEAVADVVPCLRDADEWVRAAAVEFLSLVQPREHVQDLVRMLCDPQPAVRGAACATLATLDDAGANEALAVLLTDPTASVRAEALRAVRRLGLAALVPRAESLLFDLDADVRVEAARAVGEFGTAQSVGALLRSVAADPPEVLEAVVEAIARLHAGNFAALRALAPEAPSAAQTLALIDLAGRLRGDGRYRFIASHLRAPDERMRRRAVAALPGFRRQDATRALIRAMSDPDTETRAAAVVAASLSGNVALRAAVKRCADDTHATVRRNVALALGLAAEPALYPTLRQLARDHDPKVRAAAAMALALADGTALLAELKAFTADQPLCDAARELFVPAARDPLVARIVAAAAREDRLEPHLFLGGSRFALEKEMMQRARTALRAEERARAVEICEIVATGQSYTAALTILRNDPAPSVRLRALRLLVRCRRDAEVARAVSSLLVDVCPELRVEAARVLGEIEYPEAVEALIHALDTPDRDLREAVTTSLSVRLRRDPRRAETLINEIPSGRTRKLGLVWLLGKHRRHGAMRQLSRYLEDEDGDVRAASVGALAKFPLSTVARTIQRSLSDPYSRVRAAAVNALGRSGSGEFVDALEPMLYDPDPFVRRRTAIALVRLDAAAADRGLATLGEQPPELRPVWLAGGVLAGTLEPSIALRDPDAVAVLAELYPAADAAAALRRASDPGARRAAFRVLQVVAPDEVGAAAAALLADPDPALRDDAHRAIDVYASASP